VTLKAVDAENIFGQVCCWCFHQQS